MLPKTLLYILKACPLSECEKWLEVGGSRDIDLFTLKVIITKYFQRKESKDLLRIDKSKNSKIDLET